VGRFHFDTETHFETYCFGCDVHTGTITRAEAFAAALNDADHSEDCERPCEVSVTIRGKRDPRQPLSWTFFLTE
jgi:hypothetical protein